VNEPCNLLQNYRLFHVPAVKHEAPRWATELQGVAGDQNPDLRAAFPNTFFSFKFVG
jgi:hypothetical protein